MTVNRKRLVILACACVSLYGHPDAWGAAKSDTAVEEAEAGKRAKPKVEHLTLADRIPAVSGRKFTKDGRVELEGAVGFTLSDAFYNFVAPHIGVHYYLLESLAIGLQADYLGGIAKGIEIDVKPTAPPTPNKPELGVDLSVTWLPFYGKASWLAEAVSHYDGYVNIHGGFYTLAAGGTAPMLGIGLGQHYYLNEYIAARFELRGDFFKMARAAPEDNTSTLQGLISAVIGVSFYFPDLSKP